MELYASNQAARTLGIAPTTLRKWTAELADWLSPAAQDSHERRYTDDDLHVLRRAGELLKQRRGFAHVRESLEVEFAPAERERVVGENLAWQADGASESTCEREIDAEDAAPEPASTATGPAGVVDAEVIEPEPRVAPDVAGVIERMAELYRELLRDKEQEIAALRRALDAAELLAGNERGELETLRRLSAMLERENGRLAAELEEARRRSQYPADRPTWRARLGRLLGRSPDDPLEEAA